MITEAEKEAMRRESIRLAELDRISELEVAERKGRNKGIEEGIVIGEEKGIEKGKKENQLETIKILFETGLSKEDIAKHLRLDLEYVKHVLENN